jgi:26S proteasome regulatory subunit, ATPase 3, interacting protein
MTINKLSAEEKVVFDYLAAQNRPYSATDIFNNLHGKMSKNGITKILSNLYEGEVINGKAYGKQWVYTSKHVLQIWL